MNKLGEWNILNFSFHSAFWAVNLLSNFCYGNRYKTIRENYINPYRNILHESFIKQIGEVDRTWLTLHHSIDGGR
ncbi:hypothetical protein EZS27_030612 [termite gut metagenome]|uniref:Uncharacterized protein n=1 Tax=termite gut metagenome TaxID=433724 RepID=A0A5J4QEM5_9ZZZZ